MAAGPILIGPAARFERAAKYAGCRGSRKPSGPERRSRGGMRWAARATGRGVASRRARLGRSKVGVDRGILEFLKDRLLLRTVVSNPRTVPFPPRLGGGGTQASGDRSGAVPMSGYGARRPDTRQSRLHPPCPPFASRGKVARESAGDRKSCKAVSHHPSLALPLTLIEDADRPASTGSRRAYVPSRRAAVRACAGFRRGSSGYHPISD